ncbi:C-type mannose receptor 2 [Oryzias melastigma]|uniref:C-type mannose receptor 2 n=1 Tax=Oryzias melastigma TaxID=30732 RepID=A0A834BWT4_ORYME|nr:C-type mannose receptor 2 [Oryzias melastigma]
MGQLTEDLAPFLPEAELLPLTRKSPLQDLGNKKAWIGLYREARSSRMWKWSQPEVQFNESQNKKNWTDAQNFCRNRHTDLISGPEQMKKLNVVETELLFPSDSNNDLIFIGLFRDAWQWSDGSRSSFRFWNLNYDDEESVNSCVMLNKKGRWNSEKCTETHHFVCHDDHVILINESRTWEEALYYCRHHHHDLVTITNLEEQRWVQEKTKNATTPYVWTGLRYTCTLGFWFWVSDEVVRYKNWDSPEQVNECDMSGAMETGGEHKWVKKHDEEKFNFFCSTT